MKEPKRHRAMVEVGVTRQTYWRTRSGGPHPMFDFDNEATVWVNAWGHAKTWSELPNPRRLIFKGERRGE